MVCEQIQYSNLFVGLQYLTEKFYRVRLMDKLELLTPMSPNCEKF